MTTANHCSSSKLALNPQSFHGMIVYALYLGWENGEIALILLFGEQILLILLADSPDTFKNFLFF